MTARSSMPATHRTRGQKARAQLIGLQFDYQGGGSGRSAGPMLMIGNMGILGLLARMPPTSVGGAGRRVQASAVLSSERHSGARARQHVLRRMYVSVLLGRGGLQASWLACGVIPVYCAK
jgi:hypothetical protein